MVHARDLTDEFEPVFDALERTKRSGDRLRREAERTRGGRRGQGVTEVVASEKPKFIRSAEEDLAPILSENNDALLHEGAARGDAVHAEEQDPPLAHPCPLSDERVLRVENRDVLPGLIVKDRSLRGRIGPHRAVTIQVVRREIEDNGDMGTAPDLAQVFELETGELQNHGYIRRERVEFVEQRASDVAADERSRIRPAEHRAEKRGRGGLSVASGDAEDGRGTLAKEKVHLRVEGHAAPPGEREVLGGLRHRRIHEHPIRVREVRGIVPTQFQRHTEILQCPDRLLELILGSQIGDRDPGASPDEISGNTESPAEKSETHHGDAFSFEVHWIQTAPCAYTTFTGSSPVRRVACAAFGGMYAELPGRMPYTRSPMRISPTPLTTYTAS